MATKWHLLVLLVGFASLCRSQSTTFDLAKVTTALDKDNDGNISRSDVESFFTSYMGSSAGNRCTFVNWLVTNFGGSSLRVSAFFDKIQSQDKEVGLAEIDTAFLGNPNSTGTNVADFNARIKALDNAIDMLVAKPADYTVGPTFWPYNMFDIKPWADNYDLDKNGYLTRLEISAAMRGLDLDGDWNIQRCEYIISMTAYKQHSVTSSKVYDIIFTSRDITWADVDSDFLMLMMGVSDGNATKEQVIDYFTQKNQLAAGIPINPDGSIGDGTDTAAPLSGISFWFITSSFLVFIISTYFR